MTLQNKYRLTLFNKLLEYSLQKPFSKHGLLKRNPSTFHKLAQFIRTKKPSKLSRSPSERDIYQLSHVKLANPQRSLHDQVIISNLMFWYLGRQQPSVGRVRP
ncbi:hypothetical protein G6F57_007568 [Rhizopus arrhizus]|uniref:Protein Zds1 C-terminal domain-containing protein n=1 Tax=Rhizopus oryzae TaxID=64495 RepID=A0A9P7BTT8_RHIOR|nr:hypothetical protein G6F23_002579 [Rhizopus arrhizus]KAG1420826.1 hypothetical protein G6F58_004018 [Rhizopus delemar]KAG0764756.1 hypothetical protein G6F24_004967 [Rhizopus arrhizus]KAG0790420.1 hypothetical protein G6F21_005823 [Rhizopus arrhizus]KAG0812692.1 hypothetical protein G6F20_006159 [Rhizopus arrhizus]